MANFVKHTACPACGSSDANAEYDDDSTYCFACEARSESHYTPKRKDLHMEQNDAELQRLITKWRSGTPAALPDRGITSTYVKQYGVVVDGDRHYYPYFSDDSSDPVAFKVRTVATKGFAAVGDIKTAGLFGQQRFGNHNKKRVVVCEGELDALACSQMMDGKVPVVSLRTGAIGAGRDFKAAYQFLDGFAEIVLCFDADDAGKEGVQKAADVFAGKLRVMKLDPRLGKDACDFLKTGRKAEFVQAYWDAPIYTPSGVVSKEELWEQLCKSPPVPLGDYPWERINDLTFGFRPTELITLCAGSGLGKSAVLREIVMHIKNTTENKIGVLFMEESVTRTAEGFMGIDLSTPVHLPTSAVVRGSDEYRQSFDRVFGNDQLFIMDASFDTGATVDAVVSRVRFMAKAMDCKVVVLDHISILVSGGQHGDERKALDEIMTKLRTLTQDTGITLLAVSHLKRPDGKGHEEGAVTSVAQLRGSASIAQLSDFVIGLERNAQADDPIERNTTHLRVLKNRFSGQTGPAGHLLYDTNTGRLSEHEPIQSEEDAL
jgi:twinkle protein